jgi:zinc transporter 9
LASPASSITAVITALSANAFVTGIKFVAFVLSGSGAMLSEAIHSAADTGNQVLLYLGLRRAARPADDRFHYGYGKERFVFGMLSAAGIFFVGCGVTIYHGVTSLMHPHAPELSVVTFAVLGAAFVIEGGVLVFAVISIAKQRGDLPFFRYVRERADPAAVAILLEDGVAVLGVTVAGGGILLTYFTGDPVFDAIGSLVVGGLLGVVAIYLVSENRELLLGRAIPEGVEEQFERILRARPAVKDVRDIKTKELTPESYMLKADIALDEAHLAKLLEEERGGTAHEIATAAIHEIAAEIQAMERAIRAEIPQAKYIDLEIVDPGGRK